MTPEQSTGCIDALIELFPQSDLQEAELKVFGRALLPFMESDALDAIRGHRLKCRFNRPAFSEILSDIGLRGRREQRTDKAKGYLTVIGQSMARQGQDGKPEAALILKYHRFWFFRYKKEQTANVLPNYAEIITARVNEHRVIHLQQCIRDLRASGMEPDKAEQIAEWFDANQPDFIGVVDGLEAEMALEAA